MADSVEDVKAAFPDHEVSVEELADGSAWITLHAIGIGDGWNQTAIDLAVKLQATFPDTEPYPFYCGEGLRRLGGQQFSQIQPQVAVDGAARTQISLKKGRLLRGEGLGSRFWAVLRWLRGPR